jgi:hypothetical protein
MHLVRQPKIIRVALVLEKSRCCDLSINSLYRQCRRSDLLWLAMNVPARGSEEITPPSSFRGPPLTPPPTDEEARDTSYIPRQIAKHRSGNTDRTMHKVDKRVWTAVSPLLLRVDKLQYARSVYLQGQRWCHADVEAQFRLFYFDRTPRLVYAHESA